MKKGNWLSVIAVMMFLAGCLLARAEVTLVGHVLVGAGGVLFAAGMLHAIKRRPRCPYCGEGLIPLGRRTFGGIDHVDALSQILCLNCGAVISTEDLLKQDRQE